MGVTGGTQSEKEVDTIAINGSQDSSPGVSLLPTGGGTLNIYTSVWKKEKKRQKRKGKNIIYKKEELDQVFKVQVGKKEIRLLNVSLG